MKRYRLFGWFRSRRRVATKEDLKELEKLIMEQLEEVLAELDGLKSELESTNAVVVKIGTETDGLQQKIVELEELINNGSSLDVIAAKVAEVKATAATVRAEADSVDSKVPDAEPDTEA